MITKWTTWVIPSKDLEEYTDEDKTKLRTILQDEARKAMKDIEDGLPISFKITNLSRRDEQEN